MSQNWFINEEPFSHPFTCMIVGPRDISLNSNYLVLFRNPRDKLQLSILARQMYPGDTSFFMQSFDDATKNPHGYLFLDLKQETEERNRVQTGILPLQ